MRRRNRRDFLKYATAAGVATLTSPMLYAQESPSTLSPKQREAIADLWQYEKRRAELAKNFGENFSVALLETIGSWSARNREAVLKEVVKLYDIDLSKTSQEQLLYSTEQILAMPSDTFASTQLSNLYESRYQEGASSVKEALLVMVKESVDTITHIKQTIALFNPKEKIVENLVYLSDSSMGHYWELHRQLLKIGERSGACAAGEAYCKTSQEYAISYGRDHLSKPQELSSEQRYAIAHMWSEEKMAHDAFETVYSVYPHLRLFYNIGHWSEVQHLNAVEELAALYNIDVNDASNTQKHYDQEALDQMGPGDYAISDFEDQYQNTLLPYAVQSDIHALKLGCMVEVQDVRDLTQFLEKNENPYIQRTFEYLIAGSQSHYWAYHYALIARGISEGCCAAGRDYCKDASEFPSGSGQQTLAMRWNRYDMPLDGFGRNIQYT